MDFFSGIFIAVASWFGLGGDMTVEPTPVEAQSAQEITLDSQTASGAASSSIDASDDEPATEEGSSTSDQEIAAEEQSVQSEQMQGAAAPVETQTAASVGTNYQTMIVAGGCFWCVEADLEKLNGVTEVVSGYSGGTTDNPTYENYGSGGHREVAKVTYDANQISFEDILIVTMKTTDPTDDDGTFGDRGDKYSAAFYHETSEQKQIIDNLIAEVDDRGPYDSPLAIDVEERATFWPAEDYHQDYYKGTLTQLKYQYYRSASGRNDFIDTYWGANGHSTQLPWRNQQSTNTNQSYMWSDYQKPSKTVLEERLSPLEFKVTQEDGTEPAGSSPLDKVWEDGIYVDILSKEPLYSSKDKFDSGTGWPSFVKPITPDALTLHEDRKLFSVRTETRSAIADNHIGHVFDDGPDDRGGLRYCMNGAALEFIPKAEMEEKGYGDFLQYL